MEKEKKKCWAVFCEEYPDGIIYEDKSDALEESATRRSGGDKAYTRVKFFTQKEFDELPELD